MVQYSIVQFSKSQHNITQFSIHFIIVQYSTVQYSELQVRWQPDGSDACDEHVYAQIEFEAIQEQRFLHVHLGHHRLLLGDALEAAGEEDAPALRHAHTTHT